jgi:hypothetical protein
MSKMNTKKVRLNGGSEHSEITDLTKYSKASGAGVLTSILNPKNYTKLMTLDTGNNTSRVYVETA